MKKIFFTSILFFAVLLPTGGYTYALSFAQGTQFLDAQTQSECEALGGNFTEWYEETYCTKNTYNNFEDFIDAEPSCKIATDGCNTVQIWNGKGASTMMYCEDIYGEQGQEEWSCLDQELENERVGFLSDNDRNQYYVFQEHLGEKFSARIEDIIGDFGEKVLRKSSYNTQGAIDLVDETLERFGTTIFELVMSYPTDVAMSQKDTVKYYILTVARFELQIMKNRWMNNAGIE